MKLDPIQFQFERDITPGAEAMHIAIVNSNGGKKYVAKSSTPWRAIEEVSIIARSNHACPGVFPGIVQVHLENESGYVMEHIPGCSIQELFHSVENPAASNIVRRSIASALEKIRKLHISTAEVYTSSFHETIVIDRLATIFECPLIQKRIDLVIDQIDSFSIRSMRDYELVNLSISGMSPGGLADLTVSAYLQNVPETESLVHGDPHFGNILIENLTNEIFFIDPRGTWDGKQNSKLGYFDPLYDVAAICHSLFANANIITPANVEINHRERRIYLSDGIHQVFRSYFYFSMNSLCHYMRGKPTQGEVVRFITYLACSLSGTMRYKIWTPNLNSLLSMYVLTCLTLHEAMKAAALGIDTVELKHNSRLEEYENCIQ